ncbi:MAG: P-type conjugative transfer ATPase TrbB [Candidatus Margulisbacteria bacterium]|nr:P-type conjugative transfer ATPase TrbB [Candidatus Margulisiibacteriota bacterium]
MMNSDIKARIHQKLLRELGNPIISALNDPQIIEIMLNSDGNIWVDSFDNGMSVVGQMSPPQSLSMMATIATSLHTTITRDNPILEGELPIDGSRFQGLIPPVVSNPVFAIRKKASKVFTLDDYVSSKIMNESQRKTIQKAVADKKNILVVGGTGSGKTTLTNGIIDQIVKTHPQDRLIVIEDTSEIQCTAKNKVILRTSDKVTMKQHLRATLRLRPDRILVGEVRGGEALDLLKAWNTGHPGGIATIHANTASAGLIRLEQLIGEVTTSPMQTLIAEAVDLVIFIKKTSAGRRVEEIVSVHGYDSGCYGVIHLK